MTKSAKPDLLDLAEAVARGEIGTAEAEREVNSANDVRELRGLIAAAAAVRSHARATRDGMAVDEPVGAQASGPVATIVPGSVNRGAVRRPSTRGGDGHSPRRTWMLAAATIAVGAGLIGVSVAGGNLVAPKPTPVLTLPPPTLTTLPSATTGVVEPSPAPAMVAYINSADTHALGQLWVANADGSGAHELLSALGGNQQAPVWSVDGTRLLISRAPATFDDTGYPSRDFRFYVTDASGSQPQLVDTGCVAPCTADGDAAFSRDGTHLVFVRSLAIPPTPERPGPGKAPGPTPASVIATIELSTGHVTELTSTMIVDCPLLPDQAAPGVPNCEGLHNSGPRWSPDGKQIVFVQDVPFDMNDRSMFGDFPPPPGPVLAVVDADGRNLHQIDAGHDGSADWSPDGTVIVFESVVDKDIVANKPAGSGYTYTQSRDIYTIGRDGTDLRPLTSGGASSEPSWQTDGRILFRGIVPGASRMPWVMNADGSNARQLSSTAWLGLPNQPAIAALIGP